MVEFLVFLFFLWYYHITCKKRHFYFFHFDLDALLSFVFLIVTFFKSHSNLELWQMIKKKKKKN